MESKESGTFPFVERPGAWKILFEKALILIGEVERHGTSNPLWTLGGGTVLMLKHHHRFSKDIDIFVQDAQFFGYVNPSRSDVASAITEHYEETSEYLKLYLPEGEIDFIASSPLTEQSFAVATLLGKPVRIQTSAEIIAKKIHHRGHRITGRDIFDFALVAEKEPNAIRLASPFFARHAQAILGSLNENSETLRKTFAQIDIRDYNVDFQTACEVLRAEMEKAVATR